MMIDLASELVRSAALNVKALEVFWKRVKRAQETYGATVQKALATDVSDAASPAPLPLQLLTSFAQYATDFCQRGVILQDTLRQRGNQYLEHHFAGSPPVLHFDYEMVLDARQFDRPVNYALVRIVPPAGVTVFEDRRPYIMIDPR